MPRPKGSKNKGVFCLKGKKLEGEQLRKLLGNNALMHERYNNDPEYRAKFFIDETCLNCGRLNRKYKNNANGFCNSKCRWQYIKKHDPLRWKARSLSANLIFGDGGDGHKKIDIVEQLIRDSLNQRCGYCGAKLTLRNISLVHKIPIGRAEYRRNKRGSVEQRLQADAFPNIQIICRRCNHIKGNLTDYEFTTLLSFLDMNRTLKEKILKRLASGVIVRK